MSKTTMVLFHAFRRIILKQMIYSGIKGVDLEQDSYIAIWLSQKFGNGKSLWLSTNLEKEIRKIDMVPSQMDKVLHVFQVLIDSQQKVKTTPCEGVRLECPCGEQGKLTETRHGYAYVCLHCDRRVKAHSGDRWPMGVMADEYVRHIRSECHQIFNKLQKKWQLKTTRQAYRKLAEELNCPTYLFHFGHITSLPQGMVLKGQLAHLLYQ